MATRLVPGKDVSVQFFNDDGTKNGEPILTQWVALHGTPRQNLTAGAAGLTQEEDALRGGSADWLTLIAVADTKEKLDMLVNENRDVTHTDAALTSASSLRVRVAFHIGDRRDTISNAITIATGKKHEEVAGVRALDVESIMIVPSHAALDANADVKEKFHEMIPFSKGLNPKP